MSYYLDIAYKVIIKITYLRIQEKLILIFLFENTSSSPFILVIIKPSAKKKISDYIISFNYSFTWSVAAIMVYIANLHEKPCIPFTHFYIPKKEEYTFMFMLLTEVGKPVYDS